MTIYVSGPKMQEMVVYICGNRVLSSDGHAYVPDKPWYSGNGYEKNCVWLAFHLGVIGQRFKGQDGTYSRISMERFQQLQEALADLGLKDSPDINEQLYSIMGKIYKTVTDTHRFQYPSRVMVF